MSSSNAFVRTQQIDGVWWLINGAGERFVTLGVNHVQPGCWLAPYNRDATLHRYGQDMVDANERFNPTGHAAQTWISNVLRLMRQWHFNTLGMHTHGVPTHLFKREVYYIASFHSAKLAPYQFKFGEDQFPDVFSRSFGERIAKKVREVCAANKAEPNLIGYAYTDTPAWTVPQRLLKQHPQWQVIHPWVNDLRSLGAQAAGKQQWISVLKQHHGSPADAAQVHGSNVKTWEELAGVTQWPAPMNRQLAARDSLSMLAAAADRWYSLHHQLIREHDSEHLILGDKLDNLLEFPEWILPIVKRYVDVVFVQAYRPYDEQRPILVRLHEATGKPIINGDGSFAVVKPPHQTHVKGHKVKNLKEVGEYYHAYLRGIMSLPFMLGWHHCGFLEEWDGAKPEGMQNENGLMDPFEKPYEEVLAAVIDANRNAATWHNEATK